MNITLLGTWLFKNWPGNNSENGAERGLHTVLAARSFSC